MKLQRGRTRESAESPFVHPGAELNKPTLQRGRTRESAERSLRLYENQNRTNCFNEAALVRVRRAGVVYLPTDLAAVASTRPHS